MPIQLPGIFPGSPLGQTRRAIEEVLSPIYGPGEARYMATAIMEDVTGLDRAAMLARANQALDPPQFLPIALKVTQVAKGEPLQYVLGYTDWGGLRLKVGYGVLIPRPETEWILYRIVSETKGLQNPALLDLCTGSGCLPLGYKNARPDARVAGVDVSESALQWAHRNLVGTQLQADFYEADILSGKLPEGVRGQQWQIITSNPPYVPLSEKEGMSEHVREHEPDLALFVPDQDPLLFYRRIAALAKELLAPKGYLFLETHMDSARDVVDLLREADYEGVILEDDPYDRPRLVWGRKGEFPA